MADARILNLRDLRSGTGYKSRFDMPINTARIDRRTPYGNPYAIGDPDPNGYPMDRDQVIMLYRRYIEAKMLGEPDFLEPLRGKRLACWCRPPEGFLGRLLCHGQVIIGHLDGIDPSTVE